MKARSTRWLRTLVMTVVPASLVAASFVLVPGSAASAAVPSITSMGGPVNVLPSAVDAAATAATAGTNLSRADMIALYMYRASKSPEFWALYAQAQKTAASTGKPLALTAEVAAEAKTIYPAASKIAPLVKVAGPVGQVVSAYQLASQATNGVQNLVGLDATGKVCTGTGSDLWGKITQVAAGVYDCSGYKQYNPDFKPNTDAKGGTAWGKTCAGGMCITLGASATAGQDAGFFAGRVAYAVTCSSTGTLVCGKAGDIAIWYETAESGNFNSTVIDRATYQADSSAVGQGYQQLYASLNNPQYGFSAYRAPTRIAVTTGPAPSESDFEGPSTTSADPQRTIKCVIAGSDGNTYQATSEQFKESAGALPDIECADLPPGVVATKTSLVETGGDDGDQTIWSAETPQAVQDALTNHGECGTTSQCPLVLSKDGQSCFDGADCAGWYKDPDQSRYRCTYGGQSVSMSECSTYRNRWEPETVKSGNTLADPTTGEPLKNPKPELDPNSSAGVGSSPASDDLGSYDCWPGGWGAFNPLNWVLQPIKCAFVPREGYVGKLQKQSGKAWENTSPYRYAAAMGAWGLITPGDGCGGIPVSMHYGVLNFDARLLKACPGDVLAPMAGWSRLFVAFSVSVVGMFALVRWGGALFGFEGFGRKEDD